MQEPLSDGQLMQQIAQDNAHAFDLLWRRWQGEILRYLQHFVGSRSQAEDLAQECFMRVWQARQRYQPTASFRTWLYTIARRVALDSNKRFQPTTEVWEEATLALASIPNEIQTRLSALNPERIILQRELDRVLLQGLDTLSPTLKETFLHREREELTYEQIAEIMGCPVGTVRSRLNTARKQISTFAKAWYEEKAAPTGGTIVRRQVHSTPHHIQITLQSQHSHKESTMSSVQTELKELRQEMAELRELVQGKAKAPAEKSGLCDHATQAIREQLAGSGHTRGIGIIRGVFLQNDPDSTFACFGSVTYTEANDVPTTEQLEQKLAVLGNRVVLRLLAKMMTCFFQKTEMQARKSELAAELEMSEADIEEALRPAIHSDWIREVKAQDGSEAYEYVDTDTSLLLLSLP